MNIATQARDLYGDARRLKTPRDLEYDIFARLTGALQAAQADHGPTRMPRLAAALHENRRLWTVLAVDLAHPDNAFPLDLRARLLSLARFTFAESDRILSGQGEVQVLIDINTAILRGLRRPGGAG